MPGWLFWVFRLFVFDFYFGFGGAVVRFLVFWVVLFCLGGFFCLLVGFFCFFPYCTSFSSLVLF